MSKGQKKGFQDITLCVKGKYVALEIKATKGKQFEEQKNVQRATEAALGKYYITDNVNDVKEILKELYES